VTLLAGAALGGSDPLAPCRSSPRRRTNCTSAPCASLADLDREVFQAKAQGKSVLLDFSAEWCTSCKEMERYTFTDPSVQQALKGTVLLRADVTENNADDQALLRALWHLRTADDCLLRQQRRRALAVPRRRLHEGRRLRGAHPCGGQPHLVSAPAPAPRRFAGALLATGLVALCAAGGFLVYHAIRPQRARLYPVPAAPPAAQLPAPPRAAARKIPEALPPIVLPALNGTPTTLQGFRGRLLVVNFWATWCEPCRREIPLLQHLQREHAKDGIEIVGIAVDHRQKCATMRKNTTSRTRCSWASREALR
jgi:thiol-disulfide isomerase/thioredoxin